MKKRSGLARELPILREEELRDMPTRQLLARLQRLRFCEESLRSSDMYEEEVRSCTGILFKDSPEWKAAYNDVKRILAGREHVDRRSRATVASGSKAASGRGKKTLLRRQPARSNMS